MDGKRKPQNEELREASRYRAAERHHSVVVGTKTAVDGTFTVKDSNFNDVTSTIGTTREQIAKAKKQIG